MAADLFNFFNWIFTKLVFDFLDVIDIPCQKSIKFYEKIISVLSNCIRG